MQADVGQEPEPAADLLEQLLGDRPRERIERRSAPSSGAQVGGRLGRRSASKNRATRPIGRAPELDERLAADPDGPGPGVEPGPVAVGAGHAPHVRFELARVGPPADALELRQQLVGHALPFLGVRPDLAPAPPVADDHAVAPP